MRDLIFLIEANSSHGHIEPLKLNYSDSALQPVLSAANMRQHRKLWDGYCDRFNSGEGDRQYNYAGYLLHNLYFTQFRSPKINNKPNGPIASFIKTKYKDWENFKDKFAASAMNFRGSGWVYLARDGTIKTIPNHQVRQDIVILLDVWEHSYFLDYGGSKGKYVENFWRIIDWGAINTRYMAPYRT